MFLAGPQPVPRFLGGVTDLFPLNAETNRRGAGARRSRAAAPRRRSPPATRHSTTPGVSGWRAPSRPPGRTANKGRWKGKKGVKRGETT